MALIADIPNSQLRGSSFYYNDARYSYRRSRLNTVYNDDGRGGVAGWEANTVDPGEYIQADFGELKRVQKIATQGSGGSGKWVTSYSLHYSTDGVTYVAVQADDGTGDRVFVGNVDSWTAVENSFNVLMTRYVRLYTISNRNGNGLRWELYGC